MRRSTVFSAALAALFIAGAAVAATGLLDHSFRPLAGKQAVNLRQSYGGDVLLVVNTASKCGFTPQFEALEGLHAKYKPKGFAVLGFPSGDFREQEITDEKEIAEFCTQTYGEKYPMFQKEHVIGEQATAHCDAHQTRRRANAELALDDALQVGDRLRAQVQDPGAAGR